MPSSTALTRAIRTLAGAAAVLAILLAGIAIGLYSTVYLAVPDLAAEGGKGAAQSREEGLTNPVLHLEPEPGRAGREEDRRSWPCKPQDAAGSAADKCRSVQPSIQSSQKLLVMLALLRVKP